MLLSVDFPSWLRPEIIPGLPFRWYGLMYIFAFATAFLLYRRQVRERRFPMSEDELYSLFTWGILGLLLGARIFSALVYETSDFYVLRPWLIFWPFRDGVFVGLQGMSYHGGVIGGLIAVILFSRRKRFAFREIADMYSAAIPLGYTFGRLGNFINGELYGRPTAGPLGIVFPDARPLPVSDPWVADAAEKTGAAVVNGFANLPRYPSQLFEAFFEGIVLWAVIWALRNRKPFKGFLTGIYFIGYGVIRFGIEYFREPDIDLGYIIELGGSGFPQYVRPLLSFSTGQILCFCMIAFGAVWLAAVSRFPDRSPVRLYGEDGTQGAPAEKTEREKAGERNRRRRERNRLRG
jgi:phosphatidylglycerol:prolipoprotein diacylglycerol transferase